MAARHFLLYYDHRVKEFIITKPRTWAKANKYHFPSSTFDGNDHPNDDTIEKYLIRNYEFHEEANDEFVLVCNLSLNIPQSNGKPFVR